MLKLNKLLYSTVETDVFLNQIVPSSKEQEILFKAKNDIRDYLRPRIREATIQVLGMEKAVTPRFRTQGSWSYKTCIRPAWQPPQQMDWDFGVYLPVTIWKESGPPYEMAKLYFELVEKLLTDLCAEKNWRLLPGKNTCIRVQINSWAHIDIPLYAVPEGQFELIVEKAAATYKYAADARTALTADFADDEFSLQEWSEMTETRLATRGGVWVCSDPEAVSRWFLDKVLEYKEQLRRVCQYLKAWRDYQWPDGKGPSSVCLMIIAAQVFERFEGRDDIALEKVARFVSEAILGEVKEPAIEDSDFNRLNELERKEASNKARLLADDIYLARHKNTAQTKDAVQLLTMLFGDRIPNRPDWVDADSGAEAIRQAPAIKVLAPVVNATSAG